ncbi:induced myeloid leukemia cell differentiation protein Mcl-1 [Pogona vitticeps]
MSVSENAFTGLLQGRKRVGTAVVLEKILRGQRVGHGWREAPPRPQRLATSRAGGADIKGPPAKRRSPLNGSASSYKSPRSVEEAAMFNKKTMVLCYGGAPSLVPNAPPSPGAGGVGVGAHPEAAGPSWPLRRSGHVWGPHGLAEGPCSLLGGGAGALAPSGSPRPASLALPEGELDGCEPDSGDDDEVVAAASQAEGVPSPSASLDSLPDSEPEEKKQKDEEGGEDEEEEAKAPAGRRLLLQDDLRRVTLEVVGRYLREAADEGAKGEGGGGGAPKFSLQGLMSRLGTTQGEAAGATRALETLRRVGDGILEKHQLAFQGMLRKMEIKKEEDLKTMSEVATEVFRDGIINWGRIVTLISFGAFVAKHLKSINQESSINTLTEIITDVLVTEKREWLVSHNAWEGFVKFFHVEDIEGGIRSVLMTFAGVAGLGAGLAYMIR